MTNSSTAPVITKAMKSTPITAPAMIPELLPPPTNSSFTVEKNKKMLFASKQEIDFT